ncbi:MAG: hypothetical protein ACRDD8_05815 [Bacteroidales bacterium]
MTKIELLKSFGDTCRIEYKNLIDNDVLRSDIIEAIKANGFNVNDLKEDEDSYQFHSQFWMKEQRVSGVKPLVIRSDCFYIGGCCFDFAACKIVDGCLVSDSWVISKDQVMKKYDLNDPIGWLNDDVWELLSTYADDDMYFEADVIHQVLTCDTDSADDLVSTYLPHLKGKSKSELLQVYNSIFPKVLSSAFLGMSENIESGDLKIEYKL